ncbi:MAG: hypothetical protein JO115_00330, partial [Pseudonocardiales bacterium]|nr:hypothetical protein [Pseudonocardiales bacterium]
MTQDTLLSIIPQNQSVEPEGRVVFNVQLSQAGRYYATWKASTGRFDNPGTSGGTQVYQDEADPSAAIVHEPATTRTLELAWIARGVIHDRVSIQCWVWERRSQQSAQVTFNQLTAYGFQELIDGKAEALGLTCVGHTSAYVNVVPAVSGQGANSFAYAVVTATGSVPPMAPPGQPLAADSASQPKVETPPIPPARPAIAASARRSRDLVETVIDERGGIIALPDGSAHVVFPAEALWGPTTVRITRLNSHPGSLPAGMAAASAAFDVLALGPDGPIHHFRKPVQVTLAVSGTRPAHGMSIFN